MELDQILDEIKEINLSYLLLTTKMLRVDRVSAMLRLGINHDLAEMLEKLTSAQLIKMASSNMLICRFHFDNHLIAELLSNDTREQVVSKIPCDDFIGIPNGRSHTDDATTENGSITATKQ